jgi:ribosomal protein S18 acetylase RimI-like enzyme
VTDTVVEGPQLSLRIRRAATADAAAVGEALAEAFDDYVWTTWALGDDRRHERLAELYRLEAGLAGAERGTTWLAEEYGAVLAAASWIRPDAPRLSSATAALIEAEVPALLGDREAATAAAEEATAPLRPDGSFWFLAAVGTRPVARGRGLAGALVAEGLREVDARGLAAVLETSSGANVRLYRRCGFEVIAEVDPPGGAPHVWVMARAPR